MIADKIKSLREARDMTQTTLAKTLGVTRSGINAWEMGISVPSTHYIVELAKYFNVSTDYLLGIEKSSTISTEGLTEDDIQLVCQLVEHLRNKNIADNSIYK